MTVAAQLQSTMTYEEIRAWERLLRRGVLATLCPDYAQQLATEVGRLRQREARA